MTIPFRVKLLTETAKAPHRNCESDLWDLYADDFCHSHLQDNDCGTYRALSNIFHNDPKVISDIENQSEFLSSMNHTIFNDGSCRLHPQGRILVKTGISLELPYCIKNIERINLEWLYPNEIYESYEYQFQSYAVADIRPRSGLALKHGITVLNSPGTIDNSYRKEIGVIIHNTGHEPYTINKGDKIAQMLIRPLYPSKMEIVENIEDTGRGGYGSTGKQ